MTQKFDVKRDWKHLYKPSAQAYSQIDVPPLDYIGVDGAGDPNRAIEYTQAVEALYAVAYKAKFLSKNELGRDYVVPPLEGLWWAEDMDSFARRDKSAWFWTMLILLPEWVTDTMLAEACSRAAKAKDLPALPGLRKRSLHEGLSVQIMHIGSYDDEGPVLEHLHTVYMPEHGLTFNGKHHEIYLSDPRRTVPEKLKTILRQPVRPIRMR